MWRKVNTPSKDDTYVAPTWSWASQNCEVEFGTHFYHARLKSHDYRARLMDYECSLVGQNPYGAVLPGHLILDGFCDDATVKVDTHKGRHSLALAGGANLTGSYMHTLDWTSVIDASVETGDGQELRALQRAPYEPSAPQTVCSGQVRLLWLTERCFLILAYSAKEAGAFERLGIGGEIDDDEVLTRNITPIRSRDENAKERLKIL